MVSAPPQPWGAAPSAEESNLLFAVRLGVVTAEQRRVCHETLPLFASLHSRRHTTPPHEWWRAVLDFSRSVGVVLGRSDEVPTLQGVSAPAPSQPADDRAALHRAVWELLDTCFVDQVVADGSMADALAAWLRRNHGAVLSDVPTPGSLAAVLSRVVPACSSAARPEEVEEYWPAMGLLAACGWTRCAQELLHQHSAWADWRLRKPAAKPLVAVLEALERLLMHAPHGEALGAHSHAQAWRSAVLSTLASPSLWADVEGSATERGARQVVAIMAGDQEAVMAACEQATWVELFVALLSRVHSSCSTPRDLVRLAAACMGRKHVLNRGPTVLDELLVAALARDAPEVVRLCASGLDAWMSAHVVEVLSASPDAYELVHTPVASASQGTVTLSAWYRMQYAAACAASPALLHVACEYYAAAGPQGTKALHALLCAVSEEGDPDRQLRAYGLARQFGSGATASHVCAAAGSTAEAAGALGEAIHWYIRGDLPAKLAALVDSILPPQPWGAPDMTVVTSCLDSIGPVGDHPAGPVAFVTHRAALHAALDAARRAPGEQARHHEAAALRALRALLTANDIPRERWNAALFAALPLLESPCGVVTADDTALMTARLQELALHPWERKLSEEPTHPEAQAQLAAVRLALARNLARAFTHANMAT